MSEGNNRAKLLWNFSVFLPLLIAFFVGFDFFASKIHLAVIGVFSASIAICDSLFGQIISLTASIPFSSRFPPKEAARISNRFITFHNKVFRFWLTAKISSTTAAAICAGYAVLAKNKPLLNGWEQVLVGLLYVLLGCSLRQAAYFIGTYHESRKANVMAQLEEMNEAYLKEHEKDGLPSENYKSQHNKSLKKTINQNVLTAQRVED